MKPTPEQLAKLPKWALEYVKDLENQREQAIRTLNEFVDDQTPSPFYYEDNPCTGESSGPIGKRRYIQAHNMEVFWRGVHLTISAHSYGNSGEGIHLQWEGGVRTGHDVAMIPSSYQRVRLVLPEDMRK
jgi:hypothetical protein